MMRTIDKAKIADRVRVAASGVLPLLVVSPALAEPFYMGSDVSLLPFIESRGGTYRDGGQVRPMEQIMVNRGNNLFRLRLFVNPSTNYDDPNNRGAIQTEAYTIALAQRLKATGAKILLDLHYSDTWADPGSQAKPAAWASQNWATLQTTVRNYTRDTLIQFRDAGVMPDMVQVGNETTNGMLYGTTVSPPNGGHVVYTGSTATQNQSWANFGTLINAGIQGVRDVDAQTPGLHTDVAIHVDGGDVTGRAQYFFNQLANVAGVAPASYDIMGMSFYGNTSAAVTTLQSNLSYLANNYTKKLMVLETNHAWKGTSSGTWPSTPTGQRDFFIAVRDTVRNLPNNRGQGVVWWYPESVQIPGTFMWQSGAIALFDDDTDGAGSDGHDALSALSAFALTPATWSLDGGGDWYNAMNWSGGVPMFAGNAANFGSAITTPRTVTLNGARSAAIVSFDNSNSYTIAGSTLTLDAVAGNAAISVASGSHTISAPIALNDNLDIAVTPAGQALNLTGALLATGRTINKSGAGMAALANIRAAALNINAGVVHVSPNGGDSGTSRLTNISIAGGAKLDLTDNKLIVTGMSLSAVTDLIELGRGDGSWNGTGGIMTSMTDATTGILTTLAVATADETGYAGGTFGGQPAASGNVLVMYTWGGDADLNGQLNGDDYFFIDSNVLAQAPGFHNGDFDYSGVIDGDDYFIIDSNISFAQSSGIVFSTSTGGGVLATIPEPAGMAIICAAALARPRRRRRSHYSDVPGCTKARKMSS